MGAAGCDQSRGGLRWWQVSAAATRDRDREKSGSIIPSCLRIKINNEQPDIFLCMACHCVNDISVMTFRNCSYFTLFDFRTKQEKIIHDYRKYVNRSCNYFNIHFGLTLEIELTFSNDSVKMKFGLVRPLRKKTLRVFRITEAVRVSSRSYLYQV